MSRSHSHRFSNLFASRKSRNRRDASRSRQRILEVLEPRTLLTGAVLYVNSANLGAVDGVTAATGYRTIQAAIDVASLGETIYVETGLGYNESDTVSTDSLTIEADAGQHPILDGTAQPSAGFTVNADVTGVTITGFTIQNFTLSSAVVVESVLH